MCVFLYMYVINLALHCQVEIERESEREGDLLKDKKCTRGEENQGGHQVANKDSEVDVPANSSLEVYFRCSLSYRYRPRTAATEPHGVTTKGRETDLFFIVYTVFNGLSKSNPHML